MKGWKSLLSALLVIGLNAFAADTIEKRSYQNFVDDVQAGYARSIEVSSGVAGRDITVTIVKEGKEETYSVDRPYRVSEDPVFIDFLKKNQVEYKFVENDDAMSGFSSFMGIGLLLITFSVPAAILVLVIILVVRAGRVSEKLNSLELFLRLQAGYIASASVAEPHNKGTPLVRPEPPRDQE